MLPYTIRSFRGGISDEDNKGIYGSFKFGYGLDIRKRADVLTCNYALVKESSTVVVDLIRFIVPCTDGNSYGFGDTGKIYKRKGTTWTLEYTDANGAITGAEEWNGYIYWACSTKISRIAVANADGSDWATDVAHDWNTGLTAASWHTMKIAAGELMVCNDQYLAMIDYAAAAFTAQALDLIPGNLTKCLDEDGDYVIVGTVRENNEEAGFLFSWETAALHWIKKKKLASKGINALIDAQFKYAQCGIDGEVFLADLVNKDPLFSFPDVGSVLPGGVDNKKGLALFGVSGNSSSKCGVYAYGKARGKNFPTALNFAYVSSPALITGIDYGAVRMVNGTLLVAWKSGATYGVDALSTTTKASAVYEGLEFDAKQPFRKKIFKSEKIVMNPLPSGCSIVLKYKVNGASSWTTAKTPDGSSSFSTTNAVRAIFLINTEGEVFEKRIELTPSGSDTPEIRSATTYFVFSKLGLL